MKIGFVITVLAAAGLAAAQAPQPPDRSIRTQAEAVVEAPPDLAVIRVAVVSQAADAKQAGSQNAARAEAVLAAVRGKLERAGDVKTSGYAVRPNWSEVKGNRPATITGYTVTNIVEVRTEKIQGIGDLLDVALSAGANEVQSLEFRLKDEQAVKGQALREAMRKAYANAQAMAAALGLRVTRFISAEESGAVRILSMRAPAEAMTAAKTPVDPGNIEVRATVVLTMEATGTP